MDNAVQIVLAVIGSGAFFSFITYLIQRKDNKDDKIKTLEKKIEDGLEERELAGKARYLEHREAIQNLKNSHEEDYKVLFSAIEKLTGNIQTSQATINVIADGVVGMIHNTIIYTTQPIINRGAVTYEELSTLDSLYIPYHKLGGNSECSRRYEDVNKLPKISEEEAFDRDRKAAGGE